MERVWKDNMKSQIDHTFLTGIPWMFKGICHFLLSDYHTGKYVRVVSAVRSV